MPTLVAFLVQVRQVYDEYLAKALPELSAAELNWVTLKLGQERYRAGTTIAAEGEPADRFYILTKGEAEVTRKQPNGQEKRNLDAAFTRREYDLIVVLGGAVAFTWIAELY
jgi:hypothetical protein